MNKLITAVSIITLMVSAGGGAYFGAKYQRHIDYEETKQLAVDFNCGEYDSKTGSFHFISAPMPPVIDEAIRDNQSPGIRLPDVPQPKRKPKQVTK